MEVRLRPLSEEDAQASVNWRNDPEIWAYTKSRPDHHINAEEEVEWIRRVNEDPSSRRFAIVAEDKYVGNIYLTGIQDDTAEYHIFIGDKDYWGKGVARAASNEVIKYGKDVLGLKSIYLLVNQEHERAIALYKSLGFIEVGHEKNFIKMNLDLSTDSDETAT